MITVTLGTIPFPFDRTISWLKLLLEQKIITEEVFLQYGTSDIQPLHQNPLVKALPVVQTDYLKQQIDASRLVISHAGQGSTRMLVKQQASFVILPRLAQHQEHIDDHQLMFAQGMERLGIHCCTTVEQLKAAIRQPPSPCPTDLFEGPKLVEHLQQIYSPPMAQSPRLVAI